MHACMHASVYACILIASCRLPNTCSQVVLDYTSLAPCSQRAGVAVPYMEKHHLTTLDVNALIEAFKVWRENDYEARVHVALRVHASLCVPSLPSARMHAPHAAPCNRMQALTPMHASNRAPAPMRRTS